MTLASEIVPGLAEAMELERQLLAEGKTRREVDAYMRDLRELDFELTTQQLRDEGRADDEIAEFWHSLIPGDDPESVDS